MKYHQLTTYRKQEYLKYGYEEVLAAAKPLFEDLITNLINLSKDASEQERLNLFQHCVEALNELNSRRDMGYAIDTIEREEFCEKLYEIGGLVGLDPDTYFVDNWRCW